MVKTLKETSDFYFVGRGEGPPLQGTYRQINNAFHTIDAGFFFTHSGMLLYVTL